MKKGILKTVTVSVLSAAILLGGYSCSSDDLDEFNVRRMIEEALRENNKKLEITQWKIIPIAVKKSEWKWIKEAGRYEAVYNLPELTEFTYENGAVLGYVFVGRQGDDEVQKTLPYLEVYNVTDADGKIMTPYTETISFDVQYKPDGKSTVAFYIQNSMRAQVSDDELFDYHFRIVLVW
jgi:hypothetical protein